MLRYLLDTNICIFTIKNKPAIVRHAFNQHADQMAISTVTLMELLYGAERSAAPAANLSIAEQFAARLDVLDFDAGAAAHTSEIRAELARRSTPIGPYDRMIAGHARSTGLIVVTNNRSEFDRVSGLRVVDWTSSETDTPP